MSKTLDDSVLKSRGTDLITPFSVGGQSIVPLGRKYLIETGIAVHLRDQAGAVITAVITETHEGDFYTGTVIGGSVVEPYPKLNVGTAIKFHEQFIHNVLLSESNS